MSDPPLYASRYPGYDVLATIEEWDEVTRRVVLARVHDVPPLRFFTRHEAAVLQALADVVVPQDDRPRERRVPIVEALDERLAAKKGIGFRYEDMPPDAEFWRRLPQALDAEAREGWDRGFADLHPDDRDRIVAELAAGRARSRRWEGLPLARAWSLVLAELVTHYYAHPYAWSEIGFGGPKFPSIYARPARDNPGEAQEVTE